MKLLKRLGITLAILVALFMGLGWIVASIYEEEVRKILVKQVEAKLETKVQVASLNLSVIEKFPYASLAFTDVVIRERLKPGQETDTLAYLQAVYLQFNIQDLFRGDYKIKKISAEQGFLHAWVQEDGSDNYHIWKESDGTEEAFLLELEDVELEDIHFTFSNAHKQHVMDLYAGRVGFQGAFSNDQYDLNVDANILVRTFQTAGETYALDNEVDVKTIIDIDADKAVYAFREGHLVVDREMTFDLSGVIKPGGTDIALNGRDLPILSVKSLLPTEYREVIATYEGDGILDAKVEILNAFHLRELPAITAEFGIENGSITHQESGIRLEKLYVTGAYTNGKAQKLSSSVLRIDTLAARTEQGFVRGKLTLKNFAQPYLNTNLNVQSTLPELVGFLNLKGLLEPEGNISGSLAYTGPLRNVKMLTEEDVRKMRASASVNLNGAGFGIENYPWRFTALQGDLDLKKQQLYVKDLTGNWGPEPVELDGQFRDFLMWLLIPDRDLVFNGNIKGKNLDLDRVLLAHQSEGPARAFHIPQKLVVDVDMTLEGMSYHKFTATGLSGHLYLDEQVVKVNKVKLATMDGSASGSAGLYAGPGPDFGFRSNLKVNNLEIRELFAQFDNFGQKVIRSEHLGGKANANIEFETGLDSTLNVRNESIRSDVSLEVEDGELIGLESLQDIASSIRENKIVSLFVKVKDLERDLKHIQFSTLKNEFKIRNRKLFIPKMTVRSTAVDINVEGAHDFDNAIDYSLNFRLAEVLSSKNRQAKSDVAYVEAEQDGRTRVYMTMTGTVDDPQVRFERLKLGNTALKREIEKETKTVKRVLHEELGLFSKDSTILQREPEPVKEAEMVVEWEEATPDPVGNQTEQAEKPKGVKGIMKGLQKKKKDRRKKLEQGDWSDEDDDY